ncbi:MAG: SET domain-containing protein-lysine N-methyltransferase [Chloroflexi bacterium]|nr:SET domain-containing protein-lysine N-methyltransferase [Chloroflexota bacterium]
MLSYRFYPDELPPFPNEPTRDRFEIVRGDDMVGEGVRSRATFLPGEIVFQFTGFYVSEITQFSLQVHSGLHLHDPYFMGKILHSCDPNTVVNMDQRRFIAVKPIEAGDFVTMDYAQTEDYLFKTFMCNCDAPNCRGLVTGRKQSQPTRNGIGH